MVLKLISYKVMLVRASFSPLCSHLTCLAEPHITTEITRCWEYRYFSIYLPSSQQPQVCRRLLWGICRSNSLHPGYLYNVSKSSFFSWEWTFFSVVHITNNLKCMLSTGGKFDPVVFNKMISVIYTQAHTYTERETERERERETYQWL